MRIHYRLKSSWGQRRGVVRFFLVVVIIIAGYITIDFLAPDFWWRAAVRVGHPVWLLRTATKNFVAEKVELLNSKQQLVAENELLARELESWRARALKSQALQMAYQAFASSTYDLPKSALRAPVLMRPPQAIYDILVVGAGEDEGVAVGNLAFSADSLLLGEVTRVAGGTAEVRLYSSGGHETHVRVGGKVEAVAVGRGAGMYEIKLPREVAVAVGDQVSLPSETFWFLGAVEKIITAENDPYSRILFKVPVNIWELSWIGLAQKHE